MTFFSEVNEDAKTIAPEQAALGPRVGFMESFASGWDAQTRASAQDGMWAAYADEEDTQLERMRKAGIENMPRIGLDMWAVNEATNIGPDDDFFRYKEAAKFYYGSGDERTGQRLSEYDARIQELQKQYPDLGLRTAREMYEEVIRKGRDAENRMQNERRTFGGAVGEFLGGSAASLNPRTDGLNALTLGVGGVGKTAVVRIATEAGAQGVIEALNQVTGVQEQREMMGLSSGLGDAAARMAGTALVGGVVQSAGEGLVYAGKRWFGSSKTDIAPPAPEPYKPDPNEPLLLEYKPAEWEGQAAWEADVRQYQEQLIRDLMNGTRDYTDDIIPMANYGKTRQGAARARMDIDYMAKQLDNWNGDMPFQIKPRTMTAIPSAVRGVDVPEVRIDTPGASLDAIAREIDPKLFNVFDKLADRKAEFQRWLQDPRYKAEQTAAVKKAEATVEDLSTKIENLKFNMGRVGNRRRAEMQVKLDKLLEDRAAAIEKMTVRDTPEMAAIRKELLDTDLKMRDMAPMVGRAYAHAREKWDLDAPERERIRQMIREGRKDMPTADAPILAETYADTIRQFEPTLQDKAPILKQSAKVEAQMKPNADAADYAAAIVRENMKVMDDALKVYRDSLEQVSKTAKDGVVTINGEQYKFDLDADTIFMPDETGGVKRMTIRELLDDNADAEAELKATQTCSIL
ncbi:MAG: hypothetical protein E6R03_14080 [Hyphomicrobiaceae bacterium]|nr:MAG: hypothetical protein E6R03_14080 [Hyphomicrobiaceae bacterium]